MSAARGFMLDDSAVFDQAAYDAYRAVVLPTVERHGGRFIIRGGRFQRLEGTREWHRIVGLEFPSLEALRGWYFSTEYQALKVQRLKGGRTDMVLAEETVADGAPAGGTAAAPPPGTAPAYVIADVVVHDPVAIRAYADNVAATHAGNGARYLVRGGPTEVVEGEWRPRRLIVIEFPSWDSAQTWYHSSAYQALIRVREACSTTELVLVEGHVG